MTRNIFFDHDYEIYLRSINQKLLKSSTIWRYFRDLFLLSPSDITNSVAEYVLHASSSVSSISSDSITVNSARFYAIVELVFYQMKSVSWEFVCTDTKYFAKSIRSDIGYNSWISVIRQRIKILFLVVCKMQVAAELIYARGKTQSLRLWNLCHVCLFPYSVWVSCFSSFRFQFVPHWCLYVNVVETATMTSSGMIDIEKDRCQSFADVDNTTSLSGFEIRWLTSRSCVLFFCKVKTNSAVKFNAELREHQFRKWKNDHIQLVHRQQCHYWNSVWFFTKRNLIDKADELD